MAAHPSASSSWATGMQGGSIAGSALRTTRSGVVPPTIRRRNGKAKV
jgi:hypothetical protein